MKKLIYIFFTISVIFSACEKEITNGNISSNNTNGNSDASFSVMIGVDADTYSPAELDITWMITEDSTGLIIAEGTEASNFESYTLDSNSCYNVEMTSSGDGWGDYFLIVGNDDIGTIWYGQLESGSNGIDYFCSYNAFTNDIYGCMDTLALNYNSEATVDDGNCIYTNTATWDCDPSVGCYDPGTGYGQYNSEYDCQLECGSGITASWDCDPSVGCYDPGTGYGQYNSEYECNFECGFGVTASWDCDPSFGCYDPGTGYGEYNSEYDCQLSCSDAQGYEISVTVTEGMSPSEISWEIYDPSSGETIASGGAAFFETICIPNANLFGTLEFRMYDMYGDGWESATYTIFTADGTTSGTLVDGYNGIDYFNVSGGEPCL